MAIPISNQERSLWEFAKIGESNIVPEIVGSLLYGPQNTVPLIFGNSHVAFFTRAEGELSEGFVP